MCGGGKDDGQSQGPELRDAIKRKNKSLDRYLDKERNERNRRKPLWFAALPLVLVAACSEGRHEPSNNRPRRGGP